jgi:hypothetical protein
MKYLSVVARISLAYDLVIGVAMLAATNTVAALFHVPAPQPMLFAKLLGIFLICVGLGYLPAVRDPRTYRQYLWIFGPLLKGVGATAFILDYALNGAPASFLLFAAGDGTLAVATWWGLTRLSR